LALHYLFYCASLGIDVNVTLGGSKNVILSAKFYQQNSGAVKTRHLRQYLRTYQGVRFGRFQVLFLSLVPILTGAAAELQVLGGQVLAAAVAAQEVFLPIITASLLSERQGTAHQFLPLQAVISLLTDPGQISSVQETVTILSLLRAMAAAMAGKTLLLARVPVAKPLKAALTMMPSLAKEGAAIALMATMEMTLLFLASSSPLSEEQRRHSFLLLTSLVFPYRRRLVQIISSAVLAKT
jgi:hypothetical protein